MTTIIYYSDGPRKIDVERCERYWDLHSRAYGEQSKRLPAEKRNAAAESLQAHIEVCNQCRRWYEAVEAAGG